MCFHSYVCPISIPMCFTSYLIEMTNELAHAYLLTYSNASILHMLCLYGLFFAHSDAYMWQS